jgi:hypothetical protein
MRGIFSATREAIHPKSSEVGETVGVVRAQLVCAADDLLVL